MAAIIDSAPDCITRESGTEEARVEDSADFVIGNNWQDCAGFMTFGPGSTYETVDGPGIGAEGGYMVLTWIGIAFMVARAGRLVRLREPPPGRLLAGGRPRLRRAGRPAARDHAGPQGVR